MRRLPRRIFRQTRRSIRQQSAINLHRPDAKLSFKLQSRFQPIQNVLDYIQAKSSNLEL